MKARLMVLLFIVLNVQLTSAQKKNMETNTNKETMVEIATDSGKIVVKLYNATPLHRDNFIKLANEGTLDSTLFHRVIKGFMIQGGDPTSKNAQPGQMLGAGDVGYKIPAEIIDTIFHKRGALAAARDNNPERASSGCQFYIVQGKVFNDNELSSAEARMGVKMSDTQKNIYKTIGGTPWLDGGYTVFGEVVSGMDVVDKIANMPTGANDRPATDIRMKVKVIK